MACLRAKLFNSGLRAANSRASESFSVRSLVESIEIPSMELSSACLSSAFSTLVYKDFFYTLRLLISHAFILRSASWHWISALETSNWFLRLAVSVSSLSGIRQLAYGGGGPW